MVPTSVPSIPAELIQPAPVYQVPGQHSVAHPVITIKPPDAQQINLSISGQPVNPGQQLNQIIIQPTQPLQILTIPTPRTLTLDDLLTKRQTETEDYFTIRSAYSRLAMQVFGGKINAATAALLGQMAADKVTYGVVYPEESDKVIRYINSQYSTQ